MRITVNFLKEKGFKELGNSLGAAHYRKEELNKNIFLEIRHVQDDDKWWLTNGKQCFEIYRELFAQKEIESLIEFYCFTK